MFNVSSHEKYVVAEFNHEVLGGESEALIASFDKIISMSKKYVVFDYKKVAQVDTSFYRFLMSEYKRLADSGSVHYSYGLNAQLKKKLTDDGVFDAFKHINSKKEIFSLMGVTATEKKTSSKLNVQFINPFLKATIDTFGVQANTEIKLGKAAKKETVEIDKIAIAGIIGITSDQFCGSLAICFPAKVFLFIYNNMLDTDETAINKDMEDAAGEFTNIILGQAKAQLNKEMGYVIDKSIPSVICGERVEISHISNSSSIVVPLITEVGNFYLDICLDE